MTAQKMRNVRPRPADYGDDLDEVEHSVSESVHSEGESGSDAPDDAASISDDEEQSGAGDENGFEQHISNVSFGALKQAQDAISRKRKRGSDTTPEQDQKLEVLRERLRQIKEQKAATSAKSGKKSKQDLASRREEEASDDSDSDSGPSEEDAPSKSRASKHAPTTMSSKRQVTRKRQVVDVPKRVVRDPRFDALHRSSAHPGNSEKAYSFLQDYQKSEIEELKTAIKRSKNEEDQEILRRKVGSMENKLKAKAAKDREQEIIRRHRKEERERIEQGKNPYYLKQKDIKERALVEKFKGMKSKEREKLLEKRRRKEGQKEKKRMPDARRMAG
ncbi:rRNA biogenesis RRP36 [Lecanosticta acicola]|uniref:rRNA biogenesis protein RRP36 n=1 Tax=Lecanosticta acicola TaxID=111012 RepID=A0AAI9E869_9PEZI|nr:rRNA biogenesis RRP36 [Lecanosticta acicola]